MTHAELVSRACKWLRNTFHCRVVLSELVAYTPSGETPDAIGWVNNRCILVECKMSLADFYADKKKRARWPRYPALGHWRFYLTPPGLLENTMVCLTERWGLYEVHGKRIFHVSGTKYSNAVQPPFISDRQSEVALLVSALARVKEV